MIAGIGSSCSKSGLKSFTKCLVKNKRQIGLIGIAVVEADSSGYIGTIISQQNWE
jgi:hypothetical protein